MRTRKYRSKRSKRGGANTSHLNRSNCKSYWMNMKKIGDIDVSDSDKEAFCIADNIYTNYPGLMKKMWKKPYDRLTGEKVDFIQRFKDFKKYGQFTDEKTSKKGEYETTIDIWDSPKLKY